MAKERLSKRKIIAHIRSTLEGRGIAAAEKEVHTEDTGEATLILRSMPSPEGNYIVFTVSSTPPEYGRLERRLNQGPGHKWSSFLPEPTYGLELAVFDTEDEEVLRVTSREGLLRTRESLNEMVELVIEAYRKPKIYPRDVPMMRPNP